MSAPEIRCVVCEAPSGRYSRPAGEGFRVFRCGECGLEYTHPLPTNEELATFYSDYRDVRADPRVVRRNSDGHLAYLASLGDAEQATILDYGCGEGWFVDAAGPSCWGIELYPRHPRVVSAIAALPWSQWDFITLWGVLEHLRDPVHTLRTLADALSPEGVIAITTVDAEGHIPYRLKPPEHLTYWTRDAVARAAAAADLEIAHYESYQMTQLGSVYLDRLLSRTPAQYRSRVFHDLPEFVRVPTNELRTALRRKR